MEDVVQTYLADLDDLSLEIDAIIYCSKDALISNQVKVGLKNKFLPVMARMKPLHEYVNTFPDFHMWAECNTAYAQLQTKLETLLKHNKQVKI
jgi:hypothetical protein